MSATTITIGPGELLDRYTILELKQEHAAGEPHRSRLADQLAALRGPRDALCSNPGIAAFETRLAELNRQLWELEDTLRTCERQSQFDKTFVEAARLVCRTNDARAEVKAQVDAAAGYTHPDIKIYATGRAR